MKKLLLRASLLALCFAAVQPAMAENEITVNPAPGEVTELSTFTLSFSGSWGLNDRTSKITVTGPEGVEIPAIKGKSAGTTYLVYFADDAVVTAPGDYVLTIPKDKFAIDDEPLPEFNFNYTIAGGGAGEFPAFSITPEAGDYDELSTFTVTFDTEDAVSVNTGKIHFVGAAAGYEVSAAVDGPSVVIKPVDSYGSPLTFSSIGEYTLEIGAGAFTVAGVPNPDAVVVNYTIGGEVEEWDGSYTAAPAPGSELDELSEVKITLKGVSTVSISDSAGPADFPKVYNLDDGAVVSCLGMASGTAMEITLSKTINTPGNYRLVVPAAYYCVNGRTTDVEISIDYVIAGAVETFDYTYTITPAEGIAISPDGELKIVFEAEDLQEVNYDRYASGTDAPRVTNDFGAYNPALKIDAGTANEFIFSHVWPFEVTGTYTLVIPAGYFTLVKTNGDTCGNKLIEYDFLVDTGSGIDNLEETAAPAEGQIYDLSGKALPAGPLPAGLYITRGQKILITK